VAPTAQPARVLSGRAYWWAARDHKQTGRTAVQALNRSRMVNP